MDRVDWHIAPAKQLTDDQVRLIIRSCDNIRDRLLISLLAYSGLRISEVLHLERPDIFPDQNVVMVKPRKKKRYKAVPLDLPPPMFKEIAGLLSSHKQSCVFVGHSTVCDRRWTTIENGKRVHNTEPICKGKHLSVRKAQRIWDALLKKNGLKVKGRGIHTLRHYHGTRFYEKTRDLIATQDRLHHSSPTITRAYIDVVDMKKNVKKFGVI